MVQEELIEKILNWGKLIHRSVFFLSVEERPSVFDLAGGASVHPSEHQFHMQTLSESHHQRINSIGLEGETSVRS